MNAKLKLGSTSSIMTVAASMLATFITLGILSAVVSLFQSRDASTGRLAAAERACAQRAYQSDREVCMSQWLANVHGNRVASK